MSDSRGDEEIPLLGGRLNRVVRIGDTVRRPGGDWTPTIHALLRHVRDHGFPYAPEPFGWDDQGREILSYIPGTTVGPGPDWPAWLWDEDLLADVGRITADFHRASAGFRPEGRVPWEFGPAELGPQEIVCHHDLAPYNLVFEAGRVRGLIDWDLAGPGTVRSELAFVAWQWVPFHDPLVTEYFGWRTQPDRTRRLRILLDAYGLEDRDGFIDDVIARVESNRDGILGRAGQGNGAYIRLVQQGHIEGMNRAVAFLTRERDHLAPN
jgi:Phosphotransferase enzyme family